MAGALTMAELSTQVKYDGASGFNGIVLLGNDSTHNPSTTAYPAAVGGWAGAGANSGFGGVPHGIYGYSENAAGHGVIGVNAAGADGGGAGVFGSSTIGTGVLAQSGSTALAAQSGAGIAVDASSAGSLPALRAVNNGTGRGGVFAGQAAQLRLTPGSRSTHPVRGSSGDLYADSGGRLWFCKKGGAQATWQQIA
jgi:hypothetical protein